MTTNAWSRRGHAGPNSTPHTTIFRPSAASFTPSSQIMGDGEDGEYYPPGVAPFVPPDTPPTGQRTLPAASGVCHVNHISSAILIFQRCFEILR